MTATARPTLTLALTGDLMIGRGVDQVLPAPCPPILYEAYVESAEGYVELAEERSGPILRPVSLAYPWGDVRGELERVAPDAFIVNLETALTRSPEAWPAKAVHYRASPENARMLTTAGVDCCTLANNHVLDWGREGLAETLATLDALGIRHAGAGADRARAWAPAVLEPARGGRILVFSFALGSSGVPSDWAATERRSGVALLPDLSESTRENVAEWVRAKRRAGDVVIVSLHWGGNWGWEVPPAQRAFARGLVERGGVDVVHGHSAHHVKAIEVHCGRPILYGCGDFLDDYEGIGGHEAYRSELGLLYLVTLDRAQHALTGLSMMPTRIEGLQVRRAQEADVGWLVETLGREGNRFSTSVERAKGGRLRLRWDPGQGGDGQDGDARADDGRADNGRGDEGPGEVRGHDARSDERSPAAERRRRGRATA